METNRLKVLHICTSDIGGAGLCCLRIHRSLVKEGVDSKVLMLRTSHIKDEGVFVYKKGRIKDLLWRLCNKIIRLCGLEITDYNKSINLTKKVKIFTTLPVSIFDLTKNSLVTDADIIHLHWIDNFIDYPSFLAKVNKPIVWTQHDEGLFSGIYHFVDGKKFENSIEKKYYRIKFDAVQSAKNIGIVLLSKSMYDRFHTDPMISGKMITVINNPVDCSSFHPINKAEARKIMGIPEEALVFSFAAGKIADPWKGLSCLSKALQEMNIHDTWIMAIGGTNGYGNLPLVHTTGPLSGPEAMSIAYSCADYFVMPSKKEAFAQTPIESMACGVPAIVFPVSGTEELINDINGVRANGFAIADLKQAISTAMEHKYDSYLIRQDMINRFSPAHIAKEYMSFYKEISREYSE